MPRYVYFPFGPGPRVCIGQQFAMMEAPPAAGDYRADLPSELAPDQIVEPEPLHMLRPKGSIQIIAIPCV